jgi:hypothetical protein
MKLCPGFEKPGANGNPGPGAYSSEYNQVIKSQPSWRIGSSTRNDEEKTMRRTCDFPPPGSYDPNLGAAKNKSPLWGFGSSKRGPLTVGKNCAPSMQSYNIPSKMVEGNKWSMGLKLDKHSAISANGKENPGPGNYNPDYKLAENQLPQFSIKGRYKDAKKLDVPGPGTYNKGLADKHSAPSYGFGTSPQREPTKRTLSPGPGGYKVPVQVAALPGYAMPTNKGEEFKYV